MSNVLKKFNNPKLAYKTRYDSQRDFQQILIYVADEKNPEIIKGMLAKCNLGYAKETGKVDLLFLHLYRIYEKPEGLVEALMFSLADEGDFDSVEAHFIPNMDKFNFEDSNTYTRFSLEDKELYNRFVKKHEDYNLNLFHELMTRTKEEVKNITIYIVNNFKLED